MFRIIEAVCQPLQSVFAESQYPERFHHLWLYPVGIVDMFHHSRIVACETSNGFQDFLLFLIDGCRHTIGMARVLVSD